MPENSATNIVQCLTQALDSKQPFANKNEKAVTTILPNEPWAGAGLKPLPPPTRPECA